MSNTSVPSVTMSGTAPCSSRRVHIPSIRRSNSARPSSSTAAGSSATAARTFTNSRNTVATTCLHLPLAVHVQRAPVMGFIRSTHTDGRGHRRANRAAAEVRRGLWLLVCVHLWPQFLQPTHIRICLRRAAGGHEEGEDRKSVV